MNAEVSWEGTYCSLRRGAWLLAEQMTKALTLRSTVPLTGIDPPDTCPCWESHTPTRLFLKHCEGIKEPGCHTAGLCSCGQGWEAG